MSDQKKKFEAQVYIKDKHGRYVENQKSERVKKIVELEGYSREAALARLNKCYEFIKWW